MNPSRHDQIQRLFLAACELAPDLRSDFLRRACDGDDDLRDEIESLLEHHRPTTVFQDPEDETVEGRWVRPRLPRPSADSGGSVDPAAEPPARTAGTLIGERYRIVVRLGTGATGDVYRADDLSLGQSVALKFLRPELLRQPHWLERFRQEVRLARAVTHPNVNRVHDLVELDSDVFISMEYVDGEDLRTLLRRIGKVPETKAVQIARAICMGLFAAHRQGVLHRDLKPANIMIDGRGRVQITDFGIAVWSAAGPPTGLLAGTPDFMAPELFAGDAASPRSDIYSMGVVFHELFTGTPYRRPARPDDSPTARSARDTALDPARDPVLDPALDQLPSDIGSTIRWCLAESPERRPRTALAVAAALPGGDPLTASVASGEMPSPDLVASMTALVPIRSRPLTAWFVVSVLALALAVLLGPRTLLLSRAGIVERPEAMRVEARRVIRRLGHATDARDERFGYEVERAFLRERHAGGRPYWEDLEDERPPSVYYWFRLGDQRTPVPTWLGDPLHLSRFPLEPGMFDVQLDGHGRLKRFVASPSRMPRNWPSEDEIPPDWSEAFRLAGLELDSFVSTTPLWAPPVFADSFRVWEGPYPDDPATKLRVKAASLGGLVVYFDVVEPWEADPERFALAGTTAAANMASVLTLSVLFYSTFTVAILLAWRNRKRRLGDYSAATKLACCYFALNVIQWAFGRRHAFDLAEESYAVMLTLSTSGFKAAACWVYYVALEPYARRIRPQALVSWTCLTKGDWSNPVVGRDVLIGALCGIGIVVSLQLDALSAPLFGYRTAYPQPPLLEFDLNTLQGFSYSVYLVARHLTFAIVAGLVTSFLMSAARYVTPAGWAGFALFSVGFAAIIRLGLAWEAFTPWAVALLLAVSLGALLARYGLLSLITALFVSTLLAATPLNFDPHSWQAASTLFTTSVILTLLIVSFVRGRAGIRVAPTTGVGAA